MPRGAVSGVRRPATRPRTAPAGPVNPRPSWANQRPSRTNDSDRAGRTSDRAGRTSSRAGRDRERPVRARPAPVPAAGAVRPVADGVPARRLGPDGAVQLDLRPLGRRADAAAHRGHRRGPQPARGGGPHLRPAAVAGNRLGRGAGVPVRAPGAPPGGRRVAARHRRRLPLRRRQPAGGGDDAAPRAGGPLPDAGRAHGDLRRRGARRGVLRQRRPGGLRGVALGGARPRSCWPTPSTTWTWASRTPSGARTCCRACRR